MTCELCDTIDWEKGEEYRFVKCRTCGVPMLVLREHRQFTAFEKDLIDALFRYHCHRKDLKDKTLRWEMKKIKDHAHVHFE